MSEIRGETTKQGLQEERDHARSVLKAWLKPGDEIGTVTTHGSGMTDWVECFVPARERMGIERITYYVARVIGIRLTDKGIPLKGCGYDKAADVVDSLSRALFGQGGKLSRNRLLG